MNALLRWLFPKPAQPVKVVRPVVLRPKVPTPTRVQRYAVLCWESIQAYAYNRPPAAVVCVLGASEEGAREHIRTLYAGFEAFETRLATTDDEEQGMTLSEFRNRYNTR